MVRETNGEIRQPAGTGDTAGGDAGEAPGEHWLWCPRCGHRLRNEKCKLRCERCHYFMSCSDFD